MTPEELLERHPREVVRWLRGRLGLSQVAFALRVGVSPSSVPNWEAGRAAPSPHSRARLAALLAPDLATPEGAAFLSVLGEGERADEG